MCIRDRLEIDKEIAQKVDEAMDKNQRDYYLHEQLHMISEELGEDDDTTAEAEEYRRKITALHLDEDREKKLLKEVDRPVSYTHLDVYKRQATRAVSTPAWWRCWAASRLRA